jgi:predicted transcriptional regulator of viral defense system
MPYVGSQQGREDLLALAHQMGVLRARDLVAHGIARDYLAPLVVEGHLKRVDRGLYMLPEVVQSAHAPFVQATRRIPGGIICLHSALAFHHLTSQAPEEIWVAIDRGTHQPKTTALPLHVLRFSGLARSFGVENHCVDGVPIRVYSPAKTVADCFKFRYKLGVEIAIEALRETWFARRATLSDLWTAAQICRVTSIMHPYLEMLGGA